MSWSYDPTLIASPLKDEIRFTIGDTASNSASIADETILALLGTYDYLEALAKCASARRIAISMSPDSYDEGSGGLKSEWKARDLALKQLIDDVRNGKVAAPGDEPDRPGIVTGNIRTRLPREFDIDEWSSSRFCD